MNIWIDIEDAAGNKQGSGPIVSVTDWESPRRLDRARTFRFSMPATDPKARILGSKRVARCWGVANGVIAEMGAGIIDQITTQVDGQGRAMLQVSGDDLLRELTYRTVGTLLIDDGSGGGATNGPAAILALAPGGWSLDTTIGYNSTVNPVYWSFDGETVLTALIKLAELSGEHFRLGSGRQVIWMRTDQPDSGLRAEQEGDPASLEGNPGLCLITSLEEVKDSYEAITRIYPSGAGEGAARVTLGNCTRTPPSGYSLSTGSNYIRQDALDAAQRIETSRSWKEVKPQGTGTAHAQAASNALFDLALAYLQEHVAERYFYRLALTKVDQALLPGQTLRVIYRRVVDSFVEVDIDATLHILEATTRLDARGLQTVGVQVATVRRWPQDDQSLLIQAISQGQVFSTHAQPLNGADVIGTIPGSTIGAHSHLSGDITDLLDLGAAAQLTIASGAVTKTKSYHKIETEGGAASDDLDTINGGSEGDLLILRAADGSHTVVCKDGTGNLKLAGDFSLDNIDDRLTLVHDGSAWCEIARSDNGA